MRRLAVFVTIISSALLSLGAVANVAKAAEGGAPVAEGGASLTLNLPALSYTTADTKEKPSGGSSQKSTSSGMMTQDLSQSYAKVGLDRYAVYFYPFNDAKMVSLSYLFADVVEVGLDLGINNTKRNKPKYEGTSNTFGVFATARPVIQTVGSELTLSYDSISEKNDATTDANNKLLGPTHVTTNFIKLAANAVIPMTRNLSYVGGLWYQIQNSNDKENKNKVTAGKLGVNIATLRMRLD